MLSPDLKKLINSKNLKRMYIPVNNRAIKNIRAEFGNCIDYLTARGIYLARKDKIKFYSPLEEVIANCKHPEILDLDQLKEAILKNK